MYKGNHTLVTDEWRYLRYADGTDELHNGRTDLNKWTNVAAKSTRESDFFTIHDSA